jgi:Protein of unknown function with HXXEE motif
VRRLSTTFRLLILGQAAHSIEEYVGRLWESFPPARALTGLVSQDREIGFLVINVALVAFGAWCYYWPVKKRWRSAGAIATGWAILELINGVGHPLWSLRQGGYTPGVATAPLLLVLSLVLLTQLRVDRGRESAPAG